MSHWAQVDKNNLVTNVVKCSNDQPDEGYAWLLENLGGRWIKTSYNTKHGVHEAGGQPLRVNYAAVGYIYDEQRDGFIPPKPHESWILNDSILDWEAPAPYPIDGNIYFWDESTTSWAPAEASFAFASWTFNEELSKWQPPIEPPQDGQKYSWNEGLLNWVAIPVDELPPTE